LISPHSRGNAGVAISAMGSVYMITAASKAEQ
jgi:hypothetical protein